MQTQDAPAELIFKIWPWLEANKKLLIGAGIGAVALSGILFFLSSQREQKAIEAGQAVTALLFSPAGNNNPTQLASSLERLADQYGGTAAGQRAQLQAAAALFEAGSYAEAETQFQKYLVANAGGPLAVIAKLGVAASLEAQNQPDQAAAAYQQVVSTFPASPYVLDAQFALGCIAEQQNKLAEARTHFDNVAHSTLGGSLAQEAGVRANELQAKIAAAAPKPTTSAKPAAAVSPVLQQLSPPAKP